jgi:hypothetical protein
MTPNAYAIIFGVNVVFRLFLSNFHPGSDALVVVVGKHPGRLSLRYGRTFSVVLGIRSPCCVWRDFPEQIIVSFFKPNNTYLELDGGRDSTIIRFSNVFGDLGTSITIASSS